MARPVLPAHLPRGFAQSPWSKAQWVSRRTGSSKPWWPSLFETSVDKSPPMCYCCSAMRTPLIHSLPHRNHLPAIQAGFLFPYRVFISQNHLRQLFRLACLSLSCAKVFRTTVYHNCAKRIFIHFLCLSMRNTRILSLDIHFWVNSQTLGKIGRFRFHIKSF